MYTKKCTPLQNFALPPRTTNFFENLEFHERQTLQAPEEVFLWSLVLHLLFVLA